MSAYYHQSFKVILDYHYHNKAPVKLIYNDGSKEVVYIISYDNYNIICQDLEQKKSFVVLKHSLKKIETEIKLENIIDRARKQKDK
ncbi:MAG: hypothetical protein ACOC4G_11230 [Bacillota bacterium]